MHATYFRWVWVAFAILWGFFVPKVLAFDADLFQLGWWLNALGHGCFGMILMLHIRALQHAQSPPTHRLLKLALAWPLLFCVALTLLWECGEFAWDTFGYPYMPQWGVTQKGAVDTILDVLIANVCAITTYSVMMSQDIQRVRVLSPVVIDTEE